MTTYSLTFYPAQIEQQDDICLLICPGGGYSHVSSREGAPVAKRFASYGYPCFVLQYSVAPEAFYPVAMQQLAQAMEEIRKLADNYQYKAQRIVLLGFSAGAHLAGSLAVGWHEHTIQELTGKSAQCIQPAGCILCYPVITAGKYGHQDSFRNLFDADHIPKTQFELLKETASLEKHITKQMPPVFLWHTMTDGSVPVENSLLMAKALQEQGIPTELHVFPYGGHGLALANEETSKQEDASDIIPACQQWVPLAVTWLHTI